MDDYVFLEDVGRKVTDCGAEIMKAGLRLNNADSARGARGRGRGRGRTGGGGNRSKRDLLRIQLEQREIDIDLLPVGMKLQTLNRSMWDNKCQA